jgi:hypothetical protein
MNDQPITFNSALKPGLLAGGVSVVLSLIIWSVTSDMAASKNFGYLTWLIIAVLFFYFTKELRDKSLDGFISYGKSFKFMFFITLILSVVNLIYTFLFITVIDPDMMVKVQEMAAEEMYKQNIPEETIQQSLEVQSMFFKPWIMTLIAFVGSIFYGVIIALIMSIFTKKEANNFQE